MSGKLLSVRQILPKVRPRLRKLLNFCWQLWFMLIWLPILKPQHLCSIDVPLDHRSWWRLVHPVPLNLS